MLNTWYISSSVRRLSDRNGARHCLPHSTHSIKHFRSRVHKTVPNLSNRNWQSALKWSVIVFNKLLSILEILSAVCFISRSQTPTYIFIMLVFNFEIVLCNFLNLLLTFEIVS